MTKGHRFMTYNRLEQAYRKVLARCARQKRGKLLTQYCDLVDAVDGSAWIEKERSDSLTPLRPMTIEGLKARPARHHAHTLERITA